MAKGKGSVPPSLARPRPLGPGIPALVNTSAGRSPRAALEAKAQDAPCTGPGACALLDLPHQKEGQHRASACLALPLDPHPGTTRILGWRNSRPLLYGKQGGAYPSQGLKGFFSW